MSIEVINNLFVTFNGAIMSMVVFIAYLLFLIYMTRKCSEYIAFVQKGINILLAFIGWLIILIEKANTVGVLFDSTLFYYFAIVVAAITIANTCVELLDHKVEKK